MDNKISRQRRWQLDRMAKGLCLKCGKPVKPGYRMCARHVEIDRLRKAKAKKATA
jgi:hypothetical protein